MRRGKLMPVLLAVLVALANLAFVVDGTGRVNWTFVRMPYASNYNASGVPNALDAAKTVPADLVSRIEYMLPPGLSIPQASPDLIATDARANIRLAKAANVSVTFVDQGGGYSNAVGYFTFPDGASPTKPADVREIIIFPNASLAWWAGATGLHLGDTVNLGRFEAGTNIGFVMISNGFASATGVDTRLRNDGGGAGSWAFYTLQALNPETDLAQKAHTVLLEDSGSGMVVLGFEDMLRSDGSDDDFNDVVFAISTDTAGAIDPTGMARTEDPVDTDGDGVLDRQDDFPNDRARAYSVFYPSADTEATLVFEDNWPTRADYDFNDLVVRYRFEEVTDAGSNLKDLVARFTLAARGGGLRNGFALSIPGIAPAAVASATLSIGGAAATPVTPEANQPGLVFPVFTDAYDGAPSTGECTFFNTQPECERRAGTVYELRISLSTSVPTWTLGQPPFDPFLFRRDQRGLEVHLVDHPPTALADLSLFKTGDDDSDAARGRWYKSRRNLPWAMDLPAEWVWPCERVDLAAAYPGFGAWAASGGTLYSDWYVNRVTGTCMTVDQVNGNPCPNNMIWNPVHRDCECADHQFLTDAHSCQDCPGGEASDGLVCQCSGGLTWNPYWFACSCQNNLIVRSDTGTCGCQDWEYPRAGDASQAYCDACYPGSTLAPDHLGCTCDNEGIWSPYDPWCMSQ